YFGHFGFPLALVCYLVVLLREPTKLKNDVWLTICELRINLIDSPYFNNWNEQNLDVTQSSSIIGSVFILWISLDSNLGPNSGSTERRRTMESRSKRQRENDELDGKNFQSCLWYV
ncbi:hypothetical protein MS3_00011113, partial [Schistosoma haematobium]